MNTFENRNRLRTSVMAMAMTMTLAASVSTPLLAQSQGQPGAWQYSGSVYGYLPSIGGKTRFPAPAGGSTVDISAEQILNSLDFAFMGTLQAHNGQWGVFSDLIYLNASADRAGSQDFTIGNTAIPAGTSASLGLKVKGLVWTIAGEYRVRPDPGLTIDLFGGTRLFSLKQELDYSITGSLGPMAPAGRSGTLEVKSTLWDAIVGAKGRMALGGQGSRWSVPFYVDVGTGESKLTWQAATGLSYSYSWGELTALWRYLDYEMKSGQSIQSFNFNGPMFGATFRW
jgi:hypothetical protein